MTLAELLVALTILAILGAAVFRLVVSEMRTVDLQVQQRSARAVGRSSLNFLLSELRMVEPAGIVAATPTRLEVRVPFALGLACGTSGGRTVVSLLPVDSATYTQARSSGYAWRDQSGIYTFADTTLAVSSSGAAGVCAAARITPMAAGRLVDLTPPLPAAVRPGTPIFLTQRIRYEFGPSQEIIGVGALHRTRLLDGLTEELASPFDPLARFRFFRVGSDTSEATPPASLGDLRGVELDLVALSLRPRLGGRRPERAAQRSAIFFDNVP